MSLASFPGSPGTQICISTPAQLHCLCSRVWEPGNEATWAGVCYREIGTKPASFPGLPHSNLRLYSQYNIIDNKCDNLVLEYNSATCSTNSLLLKNCVSLLVFVWIWSSYFDSWRCLQGYTGVYKEYHGQCKHALECYMGRPMMCMLFHKVNSLTLRADCGSQYICQYLFSNKCQW